MLNLKAIAVVLFCFTTAAASAQNKYQWKEATAAGYKYAFVSNDPMKARFYTLKNGLTVILSRNNKTPRIKTLIAVRAGSNNDPKDHTGLAHYLEHMLFKGTYLFGSLDSTKEKNISRGNRKTVRPIQPHYRRKSKEIDLCKDRQRIGHSREICTAE